MYYKNITIKQYANVLNIDLDLDDLALYGGLSPGKYLLITITDTGQGIKPEIMEKIFDPFFTTKFKGRGLDMAAVYGIIKNHNGYVYVESEVGKGTTVCILIPPINGPTPA